ncbi:2Fe-2S iron-sulfur cluster-binding protein [Sinimarinibacterium flocculans]|uniref:2Fe-2S iron-sulfur cluster-binding protein n=1 Tax=Sinimarinibacterium flocculans TaxID=985250 RepID=UPI0024903C5C|nr:2Fe-2S iron-sulfur cluster-binding protein [Sinimarinibacterium flocculans]
MTTITFIQHDGTRHDVEATPGESVMQAAKNENLPGILADCGGACACATCHVVVDGAWASRLPPATEVESQMLEFTADKRETSRLSCQLRIDAELDGLIVHIPAEQ